MDDIGLVYNKNNGFSRFIKCLNTTANSDVIHIYNAQGALARGMLKNYRMIDKCTLNC